MSDGAQWYVVHTYSGYENTVKATIEKYVENRGLQDLIHEISIPLETVTEITDNGPKEVERKVFPGYVLVKMVMTDDAWYIIKNVRGVTGFVTSGSTKPTPLTEDEVIQLGVEKREIVVGYKVGDTVRIMDGPLTSFSGIVEELDVEKNRVRVTVSMFGRETPVDLELDQVELSTLTDPGKTWEGFSPARNTRQRITTFYLEVLIMAQKVTGYIKLQIPAARRPLRPLSARLSASMALISHSLSASSTTAPRIRPVLRSPS